MKFNCLKAKSALRTSLGGAAISALALVATQANAQVITTMTGGAPVLAPNGNDTCYNEATTGGYITQEPLGTNTVGSTICTGQDANQNFNSSNSGYNYFGGSYYENNGYSYDGGSATTSYTAVNETTTIYDTSNPDPVVIAGPDTTTYQLTDETVSNFSAIGGGYTFQQELYNSQTVVYGSGTTGSGYSSTGEVNTDSTFYGSSTGTATFDPNTGQATYTPTAGTSALLNEGGLVLNTFSPDGESETSLTAGGLTTTGSVTAPTINTALINGTGPGGSLTLHGGTNSTTLVMDDNGFAVDLNDDTIPDFGALIDGDGNITGGIRGDWSVQGDLEVDGLTTTNGITNNGVIRTTGLNVNGGIFNSAVVGVADAAPVVVADNLFIAGFTTVSGQLNANGGIVTNNANINAGTGTITAATGNITTVNATTVNTATLSTTGAATIGTTLSVGTNLTVAGTSDLRGAIVNTSTGVGGVNNAVVVNDALTVTGNVGVGTVVINSTTNKVSGLANAALTSTSTEAVTGQQLFATNTALTSLTGRVDVLETNLNRTREKAYQGIAMNFALNAAPLNLANGEKGISGGVGIYQGEWAGAVKAQFVTESGVGLGANVGFSADAVGGGVGASIKF